MSDLVKALASNIVIRKQSASEPYVMLLGAGASINSGCSSMNQIINDLLSTREPTQFAEWEKKINDANLINAQFGDLLEKDLASEKVTLFYDIWSHLDRDTQYSILRKHLWESKKPSEGYIILANLIKDGYIKTILTTNLDNLLEKSLNSLGLYQPENFIVITNGKDKPEEIREQIESERMPFKLIKLHGSLESPLSFAFTPREVFDFETAIKPSLSRVVNQSLIIIGHSMQDRDIDMLFEEDGKEIHFVKPSPPEPISRMDLILRVRGLGSVISGDEGKFDIFLKELLNCINTEIDERIISNTGPSIEEFLQSIGFGHELKVPRSRFKNLPELYVKPMEYIDICLKLEREHIIFIIGEPHLGKTYTALYILWEYYQKGFEPLHIRHDKLIALLHQNDENIKKVFLNLFSSDAATPRIIHFDDPFGETMERRSDIFAKELHNFLSLAREFEHLRIIITSRLNIFRDAIDAISVEYIEKDLRVHTSYKRDVLLDIFHRYSQFYRPIWMSDKNIVSVLDERLPDLLPAPHNIEFFVRTSERLTSLEDVLRHVELSKEMIRALGEWMASLPDHEQIFLIWLEICSTSEVIFIELPSAKINLEEAYISTLAHMFLRRYLSGIPSNPFSHAIDKFNRIILESRDVGESNLIKYNFVHPSYHEAFWYAVKNGCSIYRLWNLIKENIQSIGTKIDIVQLGMIERYGSINRDLDKLLLISAESKEIDEQLVALKHMLKRIPKFVDLPQFHCCIKCIADSNNKNKIYNLLYDIEDCFSQLSDDTIITIATLVFNDDLQIRGWTNKILSIYYDSMRDSVKNSEIIQTWKLVKALYYPFNYCFEMEKFKEKPGKRDFSDALEFSKHLDILPEFMSFSKIDARIGILKNLNNINLSEFQMILKTNNLNLLWPIKEIFLENCEFCPMKVGNFLLRYDSKISNFMLSDFDDRLAEGFVPSHQLVSELLSCNGEVQYSMLSTLVINFEIMSSNTQLIITKLLMEVPEWWIGGSIGALMDEGLKIHLKKNVLELILNSIETNKKNKPFIGALLAEMVQLRHDPNFEFNTFFESIFKQISKDNEVLVHADLWMDHSLKEFGYFDESYWKNIKNKLWDLKYSS